MHFLQPRAKFYPVPKFSQSLLAWSFTFYIHLGRSESSGFSFPLLWSASSSYWGIYINLNPCHKQEKPYSHMLKALPQTQSLCPHYFIYSEVFLTSHMNTGIQRAAFFALKHWRNFKFFIPAVLNNLLSSVRLFRQPEPILCRKLKGKWSLILWQQQRTQLEATSARWLSCLK